MPSSAPPPPIPHKTRPPAILYRDVEHGDHGNHADHAIGSGLHYDAAAKRAGFGEWGSVADNRKAPHLMLRLNSDEATLTLAFDRRISEDEAARASARVASLFGWPTAEVHTAHHPEALYVALRPPDAVRPLLPGQSRVRVELSGLRKALGATAKGEPPLVVRCPGASWVRSEPAAAATDPVSHSSFFRMDDTNSPIQIDYGISPARFWGLVASLAAWVTGPFVAVFLAATFSRRRAASFTSKGLGLSGWALSALVSAVMLLATFPNAAAAVKTMAPPDLALPMWGFAVIPFFLCAYLTALAVQIARFRAFPPANSVKSWPEALRLPLLLTGLAVGAGIGLPAWALFGDTHPVSAGFSIGLPIAAAGVNLVAWKARRLMRARR